MGLPTSAEERFSLPFYPLIPSNISATKTVKKWQAEFEALRATAPIREFDAKGLAAYRSARAAEDAYAKQMTLESFGRKMPVSAADRQALEKALAAYQAAAKDNPDSPLAAECKLRVDSLTIELAKTSPREKSDNPSWTVATVVDGNTFTVAGKWNAGGKSGSSVKIRGYAPPAANTPEGQLARAKLQQLIQGRRIELGNNYGTDQGSLICEVFVGGRNLADFFPEY